VTARWKLRTAALLAAGGLTVHQLRYLLAYGHESGDQLAAQGHSYLTVLAPIVIAALALVVLAFAFRIARPRRGAAPEPPPAMAKMWPLASAYLLAIYVSQELLEGMIAPGHPAAIDAIVGHGGWIAFFLAVAVGGLTALVLRGAATIELAGLAVARRLPRPQKQASPVQATSSSRPTLDVLALFLAGRGPPVKAT
jgi:hypothetical protein